jgi:hypothetical protein
VEIEKLSLLFVPRPKARGMEIIMKIKDIMSVIFDRVTIYKANGNENGFEDIYKGNANDIPSNVLEMSISIIGHQKKEL